MKQQVREEMKALEEGRPAVPKWLATFELQLPVEWVEHPPDRLDMCSACARLVEQVGGCVGGRQLMAHTAMAGRLCGGAL
jgi:hypothetical protein